jgi:hypothetical protein
MTLEEAIIEVTLSAQTDQFPTLTPDQVSALVVKNQRATVWVPETEYKIGDVVQPTAPNGHFYKCVKAGSSQPVEPRWSLRTGQENLDDFLTGLVWKECGVDLDGNLYNTRNAIHEAWMMKAAMSAKDFDVSIDNQKWNRSQIYDHCLEMARAWSPFD